MYLKKFLSNLAFDDAVKWYLVATNELGKVMAERSEKTGRDCLEAGQQK